MRYFLICSVIVFVIAGCNERPTSIDNCGDGVVDIGEECDGHNLNGNYCQKYGFYSGNLSCNSDCTIDTQPCQGFGFCGDSVIQPDNEKCDGDNLLDITCKNLGYSGGTLGCKSNCRYDISQCEGAELCGNGILNSPEECDGTKLNGASCANLEGFEGGVLTCGNDCRFDTSRCYTSMVCGDGEVTGDEKCDRTNLLGQTCETLGYDGGTLSCNSFCLYNTSLCEGTKTCGDGEVQINEFCDGSDLNGETCIGYGYYGGNIGCRTDCTLDKSPCEIEGQCGDGIIQDIYGEQCEISTLNGATCESLGLIGGTLACSTNCRYDTSSCLTQSNCGDGNVTGDEECDTSNLNGQTCQLLGYDSGILQCSSSCTFDYSLCETVSSYCGDNNITVGEECDGNNLNSQTCESLGYYGGTLSCDASCNYNLTSCKSNGWCGNGIIEINEDCDGTELNSESCVSKGYYGGTLGCNNECSFDISSCENFGLCGDGNIQSSNGELCDGTNLGTESCASLGYYPGDLVCTPQCELDVSGCISEGMCGDGIIQSNYWETCDGTYLGGETCESQGFSCGTISCGDNCAFDTSSCEATEVCTLADTKCNFNYIESCNVAPNGCPHWEVTEDCIDSVKVCDDSTGIATCEAGNTTIYFSEYVEGMGLDKALEIYLNFVPGNYNMNICTVNIYFNGSTTIGTSIPLDNKWLVSRDTFVLCHSGITDSSNCDQLSNSTFFNGDDYVELVCGGTIYDTIGQKGVYMTWNSGGVSTRDMVLRRKITVQTGDATGTDPFYPDIEWEGFSSFDLTGLGVYP